uniref:Mediator of RNA polymerase II transcription subunit 29 n=1 Tax=Leptobrachium leishanense TaxID=445787 RepID=A0A8C5QLE2_9ANUR
RRRRGERALGLGGGGSGAGPGFRGGSGVWGVGESQPSSLCVSTSHPVKSADGAVQRFDKSLEEFYALCDQLELCLRLAYECLSQSYDSAKHSPTLVPTATKPDAVQTESLPYTHYLSMIKSQITCAKDIHNALLECSKKIMGKSPAAQTGP